MMLRTTFFACLVVCLTACDKQDDNSGQSNKVSETVAKTVSIPNTHFTTTRPTDVKDLADVKKDAKAGEEVLFLARVGGKAEPFIATQAIFMAADPKLKSCELLCGTCSVPQDYCCEDPDALKAGLATIQFVDPEGRPIKATAKGAGGLESLKFIVVDGMVRDRNDEGLFIVDAETIWVGGKPSMEEPLAGMMSP